MSVVIQNEYIAFTINEVPEISVKLAMNHKALTGASGIPTGIPKTGGGIPGRASKERKKKQTPTLCVTMHIPVNFGGVELFFY